MHRCCSGARHMSLGPALAAVPPPLQPPPLQHNFSVCRTADTRLCAGQSKSVPALMNCLARTPAQEQAVRPPVVRRRAPGCAGSASCFLKLTASVSSCRPHILCGVSTIRGSASRRPLEGAGWFDGASRPPHNNGSSRDDELGLGQHRNRVTGRIVKPHCPAASAAVAFRFAGLSLLLLLIWYELTRRVHPNGTAPNPRPLGVGPGTRRAQGKPVRHMTASERNTRDWT